MGRRPGGTGYAGWQRDALYFTKVTPRTHVGMCCTIRKLTHSQQLIRSWSASRLERERASKCGVDQIMSCCFVPSDVLAPCLVLETHGHFVKTPFQHVEVDLLYAWPSNNHEQLFQFVKDLLINPSSCVEHKMAIRGARLYIDVGWLRGGRGKMSPPNPSQSLAKCPDKKECSVHGACKLEGAKIPFKSQFKSYWDCHSSNSKSNV